MLETNGSGATIANYVLGGTELLSQTRSNVTSYYLQDGQGSTRALTNSAGTVTDTYSYTAFGEVYNQTGTTTNNYLYTGQQYDSLTGLYSLRARYYDPGNGRFLSRDANSYNFSNPVELNRYLYTANNPINAVDPTGYQAFVEYSTADSTADEEGAALEPMGEEFASEAEQIVEEYDTLTTYYPPNNGFVEQPRIRDLKVDEVISRYGDPTGNFASPPGTPIWERSLPYGAENSPEKLYRVARTIRGVEEGPVGAWFGQPGGGMQYHFKMSIEALEKLNYLVPIL